VAARVAVRAAVAAGARAAMATISARPAVTARATLALASLPAVAAGLGVA
jgi:hypothetical protein